MRWRDIKKKVTKEPISPTFSYTIAPILTRFKALVIDLFMILMPLTYAVFYLVYGSREGFAQHMAQGWLLILLPYFIITASFLHFKGQTPGCKAYEITLQHIKTHKNLSFAMLGLRFIMWLIACTTIFLLFLPFFRKDRRGIHDIVSSSVPILK